MTGFKFGDKVENPYGARGRISSISNGVMRVVYSDRGGSWVETYNNAWFQAYGHMLRKTPQPPERKKTSTPTKGPRRIGRKEGSVMI